jgi:hypothetical protein
VNSYKTFFLAFFFIFQVFNLKGQKSEEAIPLVGLLIEIENQFAASFSYADASLDGVFITHPKTFNSLGEALDFLKNNTSFTYNLLSGNIIAVIPENDVILFCGYLLDMATGIPVVSASINFLGQKILSGDDGKFSFKASKNIQKITVNYVGYRSLELSAQDFTTGECTTFFVSQKVEPLSEILLQNYIIKGISKSSTGALEINYVDFGILPGLIEPDVLQTIQALPGIVSSNETVSYLNVRGGTHDQNLFLWDGIKMYQTSHFFGMISTFNPYLTEEVSLIKNGSSALYGDGVSGVIAMRTSRKINDSLKVSAGINMINAGVYVDTPLFEISSLQVAARSSYNDILDTPTFRQYFKKVFQNSEVTNSIANATDRDEKFSFYDTSLRWLYRLSPKDFIRLNFLFTNNDLYVRQDEFRMSLIQSRISNLKQTNLATGLFYERLWNETTISNLQLYGSNYTIQATNLNVISEQKLNQENDVKDWGAILDTKFALNNNFAFKTGYQINETVITSFEEINNPFNTNTNRETILTNSLFGELNFVSTNYLTRFRLGGRANHISEFEVILLEPRLSFNQRFFNFFTLEVLGEQKSQTTSQVIDFQTDFLGVENRRWVLSSPEEIPILKSKQLSLGLSYTRNGLLLNAEAYIKKVDGITTQSQGFQNQFQFARTHGSYEVKGIDFLFHKNFKEFSGWLSYSISENTYFFEELNPQHFHNNIDITNVVSMGLSYDFNKLKLSTGFNWHSGAPTTIPVQSEETFGEIEYGLPNINRLPEYFRLDFSATYDFMLLPKVRGFIGISAWNLLGNKNVYNTFYRLDRDFEIEKIEQTGLGLTPNVTFRVNF